MPDSDVSEKMIQNYNVILFGSPDRNTFTAKIADALPIHLSPSDVRVGNRSLDGSLSLELVYPNPLNPSRLLALLAGTTKAAEANSIYFDPLHPGEPVPDFIVYSEDVRKFHWGGVQAVGFFSSAWDFSNNDYYIRPE